MPPRWKVEERAEWDAWTASEVRVGTPSLKSGGHRGGSGPDRRVEQQECLRFYDSVAGLVLGLVLAHAGTCFHLRNSGMLLSEAH